MSHHPRATDPPDATHTHELLPDWAFDAIIKHLQCTVDNLEDWHWWMIEPTHRSPPKPMYSISRSVIYPCIKEVDTFEWSYEEDEPGIYLIYWRKVE